MTVAEFINKVGFKVKEEDVKKVNQTISNIKSTAAKFLGALGIGFSLTKINAIAEEFNGINDKLNYALGYSEDIKDVQKEILASANKCRASYGNMVDTIVGLKQANSEVFPIEEAATFVEYVNKLGKAAGYSNGEISSMQSSIQRVAAAGRMTSADITRIARTTPALIEKICEGLGVTREELESMADSGRVTGETLKTAIMNSADSIDASFDKLDYSISDAMLHIRNQWGYFVDDVNSTLGITQTIAKAMVSGFNRIMAGLNKVRNGVVWLGQKLGGTEKALKLIAIVAGSIFAALSAGKILSFLKSVNSMLGLARGKMLALIAVFVLIALLVEDFINFLQGNNSFIGAMLENAGVDVEGVRQQFRAFADQIREVFNAVKELGKEIGGKLLSSLGQLLTKAVMKLVEVLPKILSLLEPLADMFGTVLMSGFDIIAQGLDVLIELVGSSLDVIIDLIMTLLPIIVDLVNQIAPIITNFVRGVVPVIKSLIQQLAPVIGELITMLGNVISEILPVIVDLLDKLLPLISDLIGSLLPVIVDFVKLLVPILQEVAGIILEIIAELLPPILDLLGQLVPVISDLVKSLLPAILSIVQAILPAIRQLIGVIVPFISKLVSVLGPFISQLVNSLLPLVVDILNTLGPILAEIIGVVAELLDAILPVVIDLLEAILPIISSIIKVVSPIISIVAKIAGVIVSVISKIIGAISKVLKVVGDAVGKIIGFFANAASGIMDAFGVVTGFFSGIWDTITGIFSGVGEWFSGIFSSAWEAVTNAFSAVGDFFSGIWTTIKETFTNIGSTIGDAVSGAFKSAINWVLEKAIGLINGFISALNFAIDVINYIPGVNISNIEPLEVPQLAEGGYVKANSPRNVIIGDNPREGEIVSPISKMRDTFFDVLNTFARGARVSRDTVATAAASYSSSSRSVVQNVEINNEFNGDKAIQKSASKAMDKSAKDVTAELARGLAYA